MRRASRSGTDGADTTGAVACGADGTDGMDEVGGDDEAGGDEVGGVDGLDIGARLLIRRSGSSSHGCTRLYTAVHGLSGPPAADAASAERAAGAHRQGVRQGHDGRPKGARVIATSR
ncbi:hypothetical protein BV401_22055 [Streptomyces malaysiensis subsp. malaysiensis]|uniref:Uncharacterized protein n=1 Tax=Streptomyces autolyticus TaxID=75293 RepID=A0ABM6HFI8_9ACTN|nr:hypothetical protein BV401_22055 [Streptomyces autolyticus]